MRHQVDLVDIKKLHTKYKGKVFRYALSAMDVFSLTLSLADPNRAKAKFPRGTRADTHLQGTWQFLVLYSTTKDGNSRSMAQCLVFVKRSI